MRLALALMLLGGIDERGQEVGRVFVVLLGDLLGLRRAAPTLFFGEPFDGVVDLLSDLADILVATVEAFVLRFFRGFEVFLKLSVELHERP